MRVAITGDPDQVLKPGTPADVLLGSEPDDGGGTGGGAGL